MWVTYILKARLPISELKHKEENRKRQFEIPTVLFQKGNSFFLEEEESLQTLGFKLVFKITAIKIFLGGETGLGKNI